MDIKFADYGQERDVNATEEELKIFEALKETTGRDLRLVRKSDSYVTAVLGEWDLARFKYTQRAKWVSFPTAEENYYLDPGAAELAQELYTRPEIRVLFDATRNAATEDIEAVANILEKMSNK